MATVLGTVVFVGGLPTSALAGERLCFGEQPTIVGTDGADELQGTPGPDVIDAGDGPDIVHAGRGDDLVCGRSGVYGDVEGGPAGDTLFGGSGDDRLDGGAVGDTLYGQAGDDLLIGGPGDDVLNDGAGDDRARGKKGDDLFVAGPGDDVLNGDDRDDTPGHNAVSYADAPRKVSIDLREETATSGQDKDKLRGMVDATGSNRDDTIKGGPGRNRLSGGCGDDVVSGRKGPDWFYGSYDDGGPRCRRSHTSDDDIVKGGSGDDLFNGVFYTFIGRDKIYGDDGDDIFVSNGQHETFTGGPGHDMFTAHFTGTAKGPLHLDLVSHDYSYPDNNGHVFGVEEVQGTNKADVLLGDEDGNKLFGDSGPDTLRGRGARDTAYGGSGDDDCHAEIRHGCE